MSFHHIGFIGFGLIGGSMAKAIKAANANCQITVYSRSMAPLQQAKEDGVIDCISEHIDHTFTNCDLIILCTPVIAIAEYLAKLKPILGKDCIITDVGSVKGYIHDAVSQLDMDAHFIGGHPMAGSEKTGYANADKEILANAKYVLTPTSQTTNIQLDAMVDFVKSIKSEPMVMDIKKHDCAVAGISHVPHLSACALTHLVKEQDDPQQTMHTLAAGGFKDATRIAASSPEMWEQICATNGEAISQMLSEYIHILTDIKSAIDCQTTGAIENLFSQSRDYRNTFDERCS